MAPSLTNGKDIVSNSITIVNGSRAIDLIETIDTVQGLAPENSNSLEKLATALNNDNHFFSSITTSLGNKSDKSTTYTRVETNNLLDAKVDDTEMTNYATNTGVATSLNAKQHKFIIAEIPADTGRLFDNNSTKFRAINVETPLSITATRDDYSTITSDTYDESNIDSKITTINTNSLAKRNITDSYTKTEFDNTRSSLVGTTSAILDTLQEISLSIQYR